ncbi:MAG TPA: hypothetical protein VFP84_34410 [Kofleriaceae bacterium]|nr:hypothetical protein [Kofleriaceae bacterium]
MRIALLGRLRALVPTWRFFDRAVGSPQLCVRFAVDGGAGPLGAWQPIDRLGARSSGLTRWAFAPVDNLALAYQSAVDQLVAELGELDLDDDLDDLDDLDDADFADRGALAPELDPRVLSLVAYQVVTRIARAHAPPRARLQWKIVIPDGSDYVLSPVLAS